MRKIDQLIEDFRSLPNWDEKIVVIRAIRSGRKLLMLNGIEYNIGESGVKRLKAELRKEVCEFNRKQKIDSPVRNVFTGELIQPGTRAYTRTLNLCKIKRIYSTCSEILSQDVFPHPKTAKPVRGRSLLGRKLRRMCLRR